MKIDNQTEARTIHPMVLAEMTMEGAVCMLGVARDLRDGTISSDEFIMSDFHCGTAHCICGWVEHRLEKNRSKFLRRYDPFAALPLGSYNLHRLFNGENPNDPIKAADAIENYLFNYAERPWAE